MSKKTKIIEFYRQNPNFNRAEAARKLNTNVRYIFRILQKIETGKYPAPEFEQDPFNDRIDRKYKKDSAEIEVNSFTCHTLEQAMDVADVDTETWAVDHYVINSWNVTMKVKTQVDIDDDGKPIYEDIPTTKTNWQVKVWLKPKVPQPLELAIKNLIKKLPARKPIQAKKIGNPKGDFLLEVSLNDVHWGLHAWRAESQNDWDLKLADSYYKKAVEQLLSHSGHYKKISRILFPIGQDFFHINNPENKTPRNSNPLEADNRLPKIFETGKLAVINAIDFCLGIAPVDIIYVPGNHDPETSYYLVQVLSAWYRNCKDVNVNLSPMSRKFYQWGKCMIGFTHGIDESERDLPAIMMGQEPEMFGATKFREIHIGHKHKKREIRWVSADTHVGTIVRMLPSLCGTDKWHFDRGYINKVQAGEAYLWDKNNGCIGYFTANVNGKAA